MWFHTKNEKISKELKNTRNIRNVSRITATSPSFSVLRVIVSPLNWQETLSCYYHSIFSVFAVKKISNCCSSLVSQSIPVNPATQLHVYMLTASAHVAPFWQGMLAHSLISRENEVYLVLWIENMTQVIRMNDVHAEMILYWWIHLSRISMIFIQLIDEFRLPYKPLHSDILKNMLNFLFQKDKNFWKKTRKTETQKTVAQRVSITWERRCRVLKFNVKRTSSTDYANIFRST